MGSADERHIGVAVFRGRGLALSSIMYHDDRDAQPQLAPQ
jgi:hypothetical protein